MTVSEPEPQVDPEVDPEVEALRAEAESLGLKVHPRAKADTIRRKIHEHQSEPVEEAEPEDQEPEDQEPTVKVTLDHATGDFSAGMRASATAPQRVGTRTRSWVNQRGRRKTTRVGSELDRWYESAEHWKPA